MISRRSLLALGSLTAGHAQELLRVSGRLVLAPVTVTDARNRLVRDLPPSEFVLLDDGVRQDLHVDQETMPLSLVIAVQATVDARKPLARLREAASLLGPLVLGEGGEVALVAARNEVETVAPLSVRVDEVVRQLRRLPAKGGGWRFVDAVMHSAAMLRAASPLRRKVVLVIGEARDRTSQSDLGQALAALGREHVTVYALTWSPFLMEFGREVLLEPDT
jgi:VWFA-related protein